MKAPPEGTTSVLGVESGRNTKENTDWMFKTSAISRNLYWVNYNSVLTLTKIIPKLICLKTYLPWHSVSNFLVFSLKLCFYLSKIYVSQYSSSIALLFQINVISFFLWNTLLCFSIKCALYLPLYMWKDRWKKGDYFAFEFCSSCLIVSYELLLRKDSAFKRKLMRI